MLFEQDWIKNEWLSHQPLRGSWHTQVSPVPNSRIVYLFSNPQRRAAHDKRATNLCTKKRIMQREKGARGNCILHDMDAITKIASSIFSMHNAPCYISIAVFQPPLVRLSVMPARLYFIRAGIITIVLDRLLFLFCTQFLNKIVCIGRFSSGISYFAVGRNHQ